MSSSPGTSSPTSSSSSDSVSPKNVSILSNIFNTDTIINNNNAVNSGNVSDDDGDGDGFVSGEEEFETASDKPVVADPHEETIHTTDPLLGSSMPKVLAGDDVEKYNKVRVLDVEKGDGFVGPTPFDASDSLVVATVGIKGNSNLNLNELVKETSVSVAQNDIVEGVEVSDKDKVLNLVPGEGNKAEESEMKGEEAVEGKKIEGSSVESDADVVEGKKIEALNVESDVAEMENNSEALNGENDVAVMDDKKIEALNVENDVVIEDKKNGKNDDDEMEDKEVILALVEDSALESPEISQPADSDELVETVDAKIKDVDVPFDGRVTLVNGSESDETGHVVEEAIDTKLNGVDGDFVKNSEPVVKYIGQTTDWKPISGASKDEILDVGAVATDEVMGNMQEENIEVNTFAAGSETRDLLKDDKKPETEIEQESESKVQQKESLAKNYADGEEVVSIEQVSCADGDGVKAVDSVTESMLTDAANETKNMESGIANLSAGNDGLEDRVAGKKSLLPESAELSLIVNGQVTLEDEAKNHTDDEVELKGLVLDEETDGMIFGSSEAAKQFIEELERGAAGGGSHSGGESSHDHSQRIDGQIVTDSDEEVDTDEEGGKELFDSAALAALLKAASGADSEGGNITITSQDGTRLFSVERPAGLGSSLRSLKPAPRTNRTNLFTPSNSLSSVAESEKNMSDEEKKKLEKFQMLRVKFLRLVERLGASSDETVAAQVLYRLALVAGRQTSQLFSLDAAKKTALLLEAEGKDDFDFSVNILVIGKSGVGKSATVNSIFGEEKATIDAFEPATTTVKEISGMVDGVKIRVFDTPGLRSSVMDQAFNRSVLSSVKKFTKKTPPDIILYVDRLDAQTRDLNDLPLLRTITSSLGSSIWRSAIVTLTHAASAPPDGPSGSPLSYEVFASQRSHVVQQSIGQAVGELRMMSPSLMNPISLVENHPLCRKNREGQKVLPNGQTWRPQLLLLCYSIKILSEANSHSKPQDPFDHRKLFGFRVRSPPLPYMLSSMLQSRAHPKLSTEQGGDNGDSDVDLADLSDSDQEEDEEEYDQLPPFKPLRKSQITKLSKEQRKAYFDEYDYRVKLLQKKQWREELKRMREIRKKGKDAATDYGYMEEDADAGAAAPVAVPLPDMVLPPSFDCDNPAYRYRFLEPTSQFLARPVLDTHGWDHDCGYDGVNLEQSLAIASRFPAAVTLQITKDKKEFNINLDSSVSTKHGENGSSMAGFDIQTIGKQLGYIVRGETKFKNLKKNKTGAGVSITFLGETVATGFKIEDQIVLGKQYVLVGSAGTVRSQNDAAYGANFELQRREKDYPIGQVQSTFGLSVIKWRGDLALVFNSLAQFSIGRNSKVAVRAGINNKLSGQITVRTSSSEHLSLALACIIPSAISIYKKLWPDVGEKYSIY